MLRSELWPFLKPPPQLLRMWLYLVPGPLNRQLRQKEVIWGARTQSDRSPCEKRSGQGHTQRVTAWGRGEKMPSASPGARPQRSPPRWRRDLGLPASGPEKANLVYTTRSTQLTPHSRGEGLTAFPLRSGTRPGCWLLPLLYNTLL